MANSKINFRKEREFGDYFNDTFGFIIQEIKPLGKVILYLVVPFLLLFSISYVLYAVKMQETMQSIPGFSNDPTDFANNFGKSLGMLYGSLLPYILTIAFLGLISTTMMYCSVYSYIKLYVQGSENISIQDVWLEVKKKFFAVLGTFIVTGIIVSIGFVLCILPGIYFIVSLSLIFSIMFFEGKGFSISFGRSMNLINNNWWLAFGILLVALIIYYIFTIAFSVPSIIIGLPSILENIQNPKVINFSLTYYIVTSITQLLTLLATVLPIVITAILYFSYVEKIEKPQLMEKIDQMNNEI